MVTYLRYKIEETLTLRAFGPKAMDHPSIGMECPPCDKPFVPEDYTTLIPLGPGDSDERREKARGGGWFTAVAIEVHYACATGSHANLADAVKEIGSET